MTDNIQVAVRVRPLIAREIQRNEKALWEVKNGKCIAQISSSEAFCFDRVFSPAEDNFEVYEDLCLPIVRSVMQGFNGTIFAYGQTSSGKTFTMMGKHNGISKGVIQNSITDIFSMIQEMPEREFLLRVSFLEIYNEKVYDLLSEKNEDLKVLEDSYGNIKVNGLQEKIVQTEEQIWKWMRKGQKKRRIGETQMNQVSSRSHSIFRMIIESRLKDEDSAGVNVSQLNLVDLAGSEDLKQTDTKGERFKEGVHINLSLWTLIQVISQLSEKEDQFINYRSSKLTRLLQNSLGGNALTAIICAVTPASSKETLKTLSFAQRAKKIKNKPKKNEIMTDQALLKRYANEIKKLSQELQVSKEQGKELAEKTKQNEKLKRQIEALKANFVSQTVVSKSCRRETWGGHLDARRLRIETFPTLYPSQSNFDLPTLEEEPEGLLSDLNGISICSSVRASVSRHISDAQTQTDIINEPDIDYEGAMTLVSEMKSKLEALQMELTELQAFTTWERQCLKAESELQTENENLKNENHILQERLYSALDKLHEISNSDFHSSDDIFESSHKISKTAIFYDSEKKVFTKECQTSPLKSGNIMEEKNKLEQDLRQKSTDLEVFSAQVKALEAKLRLTQSELDSQSVLLKVLEEKYEKESAEMKHQLSETQSKCLKEKDLESEEINRNFRQKIIDLEASYCAQTEALEAKLKLMKSELKTQSVVFKDQEEKYVKEIANMKYQLQEFQNRCLQEKNELENVNRVLREKIIDLETSNYSQTDALKAKLDLFLSELNMKDMLIKELEAKHLKTSSEESDDFELHMKHLHRKVEELEKCNADLRQKITELGACHTSEMKDAGRKFEELEECNANLRQKITELGACHTSEMKDAERKFETAQSKLLLTTKQLEVVEKELTAVKSQLRENEFHELTFQTKHAELEQCYNKLTQEVKDLKTIHSAKVKELEENFEAERSEYHDLALKLVNDAEIKHCQELSEQEEKITNILKATYSNRMDVYIKEACNLREEIEKIKCKNLQLTNTKHHHLERIRELEDQVHLESLEKVSMVIGVKKERDRDLLASIAKYESIINEYRNKQRQCKDINRQLRSQVKHYIEEIEKTRESQTDCSSLQHLKDNIHDLTCERDTLLQKYTVANQKISKLEKNLKDTNQNKLVKDPCNCEDLKEKNKVLQFDLVQKKAKIISLEENKTNMIQEIKHLRDEISLKVVPCKCKKNIEGSELSLGNTPKNEKEKLEEKSQSDAIVLESYVIKPEPLDSDIREQTDTSSQEKMDQTGLYLSDGGSGPANMVKCYWLERKLYKREREINKLKQEVAVLNSELRAAKTRPQLSSESKPGVKSLEVARNPFSPISERNGDFTNKTPYQTYPADVPKFIGKRALKEKNRRNSSKPYEHPPKPEVKEELEVQSGTHIMPVEMKENRNTGKLKVSGLDLVYDDPPECSQQ